MPTLVRFRAVIALVVLVQLCLGISLAASRADEQSDAIQSFLETYSSQRDQYGLDMAAVDLRDLNAGRAVISVLNSPLEDADSFGVLAMKIVEAPRLLVWLALVPDSQELDGKFTRAVLAQGLDGSKVRYQHINLPWPIKDRHWVIQVENNVDIAEASDGRIWERQWRLHSQGRQVIDSAFTDGTIVGITQRSLDRSVYLPTNRGTWTLFDLGQNRTLVAAFVDVTLGGLIPDRLVRGYTKRELEEGFASLDGLIDRAHTNLDGPSRIYDGWGHPISKNEAVVTRRDWKGKPASDISQEAETSME